MSPPNTHTHTLSAPAGVPGSRTVTEQDGEQEQKKRKKEAGPAHPRKTGPFSSSPMGGRRMAIMAVGGSDDECDMS